MLLSSCVHHVTLCFINIFKCSTQNHKQTSKLTINTIQNPDIQPKITINTIQNP